MVNCLVTKLKGTVDNNDLLKLDECLLPNQHLIKINHAGGSGVTLRAKNNNLYDQNNQLISYATSGQVCYTNGDSEIMLGNVYNVSSLSEIVVPSSIMRILPKLYFAPSLTFDLNSKFEDLANKPNPASCEYFSIGSNKVAFPGFQDSDLLFFRNWTLLGELTLGYNTQYAHKYCPDGQEIDLSAWGAAIPDTLRKFKALGASCKGSIESFVQAIRNNKETGNMTFVTGYSSLITFNDTNVPYTSEVEHSLSWTNNTITFDGVTINA